MGGDGQALQNKRSLLQKSKLYEKQVDSDDDNNNEKPSEKERRVERWTHCALCLAPLEFPVAFELGGNIFSKQAVVTLLAERRKALALGDNSTEGESLGIRKLTDVREIENEVSPTNPRVCCPVSGVSAAAGIHKFIGFWDCGHVVCSTTVPDGDKIPAEKECPVCGIVSCVVPLVLDSQVESTTQRKCLRAFLRAKKKRPREHGTD